MFLVVLINLRTRANSVSEGRTERNAGKLQTNSIGKLSGCWKHSGFRKASARLPRGKQTVLYSLTELRVQLIMHLTTSSRKLVGWRVGGHQEATSSKAPYCHQTSPKLTNSSLVLGSLANQQVTRSQKWLHQVHNGAVAHASSWPYY